MTQTVNNSRISTTEFAQSPNPHEMIRALRFVSIAQNLKMGSIGRSLLLLVIVLNSQSLQAEGPKDYPPGELGKIVRLGEEIVSKTSTHPLSKEYVGNKLNCTSCHLENGRDPRAGSFLGTAAAYPAWSPREQKVITLEDRILNCFMRSQNGIRPENGSEVPVAIAAYITWLSEGTPIKMNPQGPFGPRKIPHLPAASEPENLTRGQAGFEKLCADCHQSNGQGDEENPPLWGKFSYNTGAGLSQNPRLADWLKVAMPPGDPHLTDQQARDIAAYINSHERPKFVYKNHLPKPKK